MRSGLEHQSFNCRVFKVPSDFHFSELAVDMVRIHVEIVTLQGVTIHSSIDRVKIDIFEWVVWMEIDNHFESCHMRRLEHNILAVSSDLGSRNIWRVVVAAIGNFSMEQEP